MINRDVSRGVIRGVILREKPLIRIPPSLFTVFTVNYITLFAVL